MTLAVAKAAYGKKEFDFADDFLYVTKREDGKFVVLYLINTSYSAGDIHRIKESVHVKYETLAEAVLRSRLGDTQIQVRVDPEVLGEHLRESH